MIDKRNMGTRRPSKKLDHKKAGSFCITKVVGKRAFYMSSTCNYERVVRHILHYTCNCWNHTELAERRAEEGDLQPLSRLTEKSTMLFGRLLTVKRITGGEEKPLNTLYYGKVTLMKKELGKYMIS